MNTALKIIRTIIGLPIAVVIWPFAFTIAAFICIVFHAGLCLLWLADGKYNPYCWADRCTLDDVNEAVLNTLTLPYKFIKKVWK